MAARTEGREREREAKKGNVEKNAHGRKNYENDEG